MGAKHSIISAAACESNRKDTSFDSGDSSETPPLQSGTPASVPRLPPPQLMRPETFEEKLYRKVCFFFYCAAIIFLVWICEHILHTTICSIRLFSDSSLDISLLQQPGYQFDIYPF